MKLPFYDYVYFMCSLCGLRSLPMGFHKSMLVTRDANSQLDPSCVSAPPATNVDLFERFAERLFKSYSISYLPCRRVAGDSLYVGMPYAWSIDRTAKTTPS